MPLRAVFQNRLIFAGLFLAVLVPSVYFRFHALGRQSFWQDEIHTAVYVNDRPSLARVVYRVATWDLHSPLYYVVLRMHVWALQTLHFKLTDGNLRTISAVLGSLAVMAIFFLGLAVWNNRWWALLAMFLAGLSMYGVYYSQELRMYALVLILASAILYCQLRLWDEIGRLRHWHAAAYVAASAGLLYTSLIGLFFVAGSLAALLLQSILERKNRPGLWRVPILLGGIILLAYLPWAGVMWRQSQTLKGGLGTGMVILNARELLKFALENLLFHSWKIGPEIDLINKIVRSLLPFALLNLLAPERRREHGLMLLGFGLTFLIYYGLTYGRPFHTGRYLSPWWPYSVYLVTAAFSGISVLLGKMRASWALAGGLLAIGFSVFYAGVQIRQLNYYFSGFEKDNYRAAVAYLNHQLRPGQFVRVKSRWHQLCFEYYGLSKPLLRWDQPRPVHGQLFFVDNEDPKKIPQLAGADFHRVPWDIPTLNLYLEQPTESH